MNEPPPLRSLAFLGGQQAPRASDGIGVKLLLCCPSCQRIWVQDGKRVELDLTEDQVRARAQELCADLTALPSCTCRRCLARTGGGVIEIDEYGQGKGFGFSWEYPSPHPIHALLVILSAHWIGHRTDPGAVLPDIVTRPRKMRQVLTWFAELPASPPLTPLDAGDPELVSHLMSGNPPGFGQQGTEQWRWRTSMGVAPCPPLGGPALLLLALALPPAAAAAVGELFPTWQALARLTLQASVVGDQAQEDY